MRRSRPLSALELFLLETLHADRGSVRTRRLDFLARRAGVIEQRGDVCSRPGQVLAALAELRRRGLVVKLASLRLRTTSWYLADLSKLPKALVA